MPAARQPALSSAVAVAVTATMGPGCLVVARARMVAVVAKPSITGIWQSIRMAA